MKKLSAHPPLVLLSRGDSYSSGRAGIPKVMTWPARLQELGVPDRRLRVVARAKSGATAAKVVRALARSDHDLKRVDAVVLTVGGNDARYASVLLRATQPVPGWREPVARIKQRIDRIGPRLVGVCRAVRRRHPDAWCAILGYPHVMSEEHPLALWPAPRPVRDGLDYFAEVMSRAADAADVRFLDPREHFTGHEAGTAEPWIRGLHLSWRSDGLIGGSFHPNERGHWELARFVRAGLLDHLAKTRSVQS